MSATIDPDRMRLIDKYAGIPLTFAATLLQSLRRVLARGKSTSRPRKILFIELAEMGSTILADPALRKSRDHFGAEIYFVIFRKNKPSLTLLKTVPEEHIFIIDESSLPTLFISVLRFIGWSRRMGIDTVVDLELFSRFSALLTWLSGAANRVGFYPFHSEGLYRGELLTHRVAYNPHIHIAKNFLALIYALLAETREVPFAKRVISDEEIVLPMAPITLESRAAMTEKISAVFPAFDSSRQRLVLINPNASQLLPQRRWEPSRFVRLTQLILAHFQEAVVAITGAPEELADSIEILGAIGSERCFNLTGLLRLEELTTLYSLADLMVTNDSGPAHFASITSMPTIVLFGPETPRLYGSLGNSRPIYAGLACSPCVSAANHRKTACRDNICLQVISVEMVFDQVLQVLNRGNDNLSVKNTEPLG